MAFCGLQKFVAYAKRFFRLSHIFSGNNVQHGIAYRARSKPQTVSKATKRHANYTLPRHNAHLTFCGDSCAMAARLCHKTPGEWKREFLYYQIRSTCQPNLQRSITRYPLLVQYVSTIMIVRVSDWARSITHITREASATLIGRHYALFHERNIVDSIALDGSVDIPTLAHPAP